MTGTLAYILSKKIALGAVSGIQNITLSPTGQLVFNFKNGTTATWQIPLPDDGKDGVSITNVQIDSNNHLICTMSDSSTIDAGELPGGGGLVQVDKKSDLPNPGKSDTVYLVVNEDTIYYWNTKINQYKPIADGDSANSIDFMTDQIEFDDVSQTFDLPIDNKTMNVYVNGMYMTEGEDYTIDRTTTPNTITFVEVWETVDICTVTWMKGNVSGGGGGGTVDNASFATKEDIDNLFTNLPDIPPDDDSIYAKKEDIDALFASDISPTPDITSLATKQDIDNLFK